MSELVTWADVVEEIFERGLSFDLLRGGTARSLTMARSPAGIWTAAWTNHAANEENWAMRMHGHDKEHALSGLCRRLKEMNALLSSEAKRRETPLPGSSPGLRAAPASLPLPKKK